MNIKKILTNKTFQSFGILGILIVGIITIIILKDKIFPLNNPLTQPSFIGNKFTSQNKFDLYKKNQDVSPQQEKIREDIQDAITGNNLPDLLNYLTYLINSNNQAIECEGQHQSKCENIPLSNKELKWLYFTRAETRWEIAAPGDSKPQEGGRDPHMSQEEVNRISAEILLANDDYTRALDIDPENLFSPSNQRILNLRGRLSIAFGRYEDALKDFNESLRIDPTYLITYFYRGSMKVTYTQDYTTGCEDLKAGLNNPKDTDGSVHRATLSLLSTYCK